MYNVEKDFEDEPVSEVPVACEVEDEVEQVGLVSLDDLRKRTDIAALKPRDQHFVRNVLSSASDHDPASSRRLDSLGLGLMGLGLTGGCSRGKDATMLVSHGLGSSRCCVPWCVASPEARNAWGWADAFGLPVQPCHALGFPHKVSQVCQQQLKADPQQSTLAKSLGRALAIVAPNALPLGTRFRWTLGSVGDWG